MDITQLSFELLIGPMLRCDRSSRMLNVHFQSPNCSETDYIQYVCWTHRKPWLLLIETWRQLEIITIKSDDRRIEETLNSFINIVMLWNSTKKPHQTGRMRTSRSKEVNTNKQKDNSKWNIFLRCKKWHKYQWKLNCMPLWCALC